ncbi:MAG TPA: hypothetical protein VJV05_13260 [Pyrinomonadaceae bacterium]|nr:hypothetical protein [Pyrinomonadaceae bacterium]
MTINKKVIFTLLAMAIFGLNLTSSAQTVKPAATTDSKLETMLKEIKATYKPFQGGFIVSYEGKEMAEIDLIIVPVESSVAILSDAAAGKEIDLTPEKMRKLLEFNSRSDYIKVGVSDIGSIRVQSEQNLTLISPKFFEELLDQVAAGTDEVAKIVGPIKKAPGAKD